ncbi:MAG TPA: hypothetical protein VG099_29095 [Gemmataceae bacterium]|nr:hypothetical protein [Gemmataceae bacterium]
MPNHNRVRRALNEQRLAHGADRNARNKSGKTVAEIGRAHAGIVRLLTQ